MNEVIFSLFSLEELKKKSTINIKDEKEIFSSKLGTGSNVYCSICPNPKTCPGHIGYIQLCTPIIHPLYKNQLLKTINSICHSCHRLLGSDIHLNEKIYEILTKIHFCIHCKSLSVKYCLNNNKNTLCLKSDNSIILDLNQAINILAKLNKEDLKKLGFNNNSHPKNFILQAIPVSPNCVRLKGDFITKCYNKIIQINKKAFKKEEETIKHKHSLSIHKEYTSLLGIEKPLSEDTTRSLKQIISGKTGTFRKFSLGKRNKYCGRSVISPDPNLNIDTIKIPKSFVKNMPFKETNTINNNKKHRSIQNGDIILLNRQPSLQRMSLMAFKTKISDKGSTIVLNPAVCPAFNADFDGDEMNIFFPTNHISRVEAIELLDVKKCIISPQNNEPVIHPIQDSISALYMLTSDKTTISLQTFCDCLTTCYEKIPQNKKEKISKFNKKKQNRTGKELFSYILPNITYITNDLKIISGTLIKGQVNANALKNIIKTITTEIDEYEAANFISNTQLITNRWLIEKGLSIGYEDCYIKNKSKNKIKTNLTKTTTKGITEKTIYIQLNNIKNISQKIAMQTVQQKDITNNEDNPMLEIINSGAKGSITNFTQIILLVGQQYIQGKRPEKKLSNRTRTLPHFNQNDDSPEALGFCLNSYSEGLSPTEYFFHSQGAREGLINTGVNTSTTGYIQRKFAKSLEDVKICYDGTTRCGTNIIQF